MGRFAIMRLQKVHTFGQIGGLGKHLERDRTTPNADPELTRLNEPLAGSGDWVADVKARLAVAPIVRKNAVLAIEFMITASPEWFADGANTKEKAQRRDAWRDATMAWLRENYGPDNVVAAILHRDETTPHIQALVVPVDFRGRLNARGFVGGDRRRLAQLQDSYAAQVAPLGLERGVRGSLAHHQDIKRFYARMQEHERTLPREREAAVAQITALEQQVRDLTRQVRDLQQELADRDERVAEGRVRTALQGPTRPTERNPRPPFRAPERDDREWGRVRDTLVKQHSLPASTVDRLYAEGRLYAAQQGHAVWLHQDEGGQVTGATLEREDLALAPGSREGWFGATLPAREGPGNQRHTLILADTPAEALAATELHHRLYGGREAGPVTVVAVDQTGRPPVREAGRVLEEGGVVRIAVGDDRLAEQIRGQFPAHRPEQVIRDRPALGSWCEGLRQHDLATRDPKRADRELHARWRQNAPNERSRASLRDAVQRWGPQRDHGRGGYER